MPLRLTTRQPDFEARFCALLALKREVSEDVDQAVRGIIANVRQRGDAALIEYSSRFDRVDLAKTGIELTRQEIRAARGACDPKALAALEFAHARILSFHQLQKPADMLFTDAAGVTLGWRWTAIESAGLYVPGGTASYPSSVLMNAVPAIVAGVGQLSMTVPAPDGIIAPLVMAAADIAGVNRVYRVGGAQAIAALAYGTETIASVAKITGPGNAYVAAAKRQVFGAVGIDMIAGPSEVLIIADGTANADWIAADLLAQAEHDTASQSLLITDDAGLAGRVERALEGQLKTLPRAGIAGASWADFGAIILVSSLAEAAALANRIAAEHVEIMTADADAMSRQIRNAGAIFLGSHTPEAIGDYTGGSNHVLPTARSARYASGLGVLDFMKRTSILKCTPESLQALAGPAIALGEAEGLHGHARSVAIRLNRRIG